jgi:hypothetical protein
MAQNKKRKGHPYRKPADIKPSQRVKGSSIWAVLFAAFGLLVAFFVSGLNYTVLLIGAVTGGIIGYLIGKNMEKQASKK